MPRPRKTPRPRKNPRPRKSTRSRPTAISRSLIDAARTLSAACGKLRFAEPVTHLYNPLTYAWPLHEQYLRRFGRGKKRVLFLGMNPGPWGMAQTGVPFGEVAAVRDWMGLTGELLNPPDDNTGGHPKRPLLGLDSPRSEVSGRRLWELMANRFGTPEAFFNDPRESFAGGGESSGGRGGHFVCNYCPLVFMEASGRNRTPDKLPATERQPLEEACNAHLATVVNLLQPTFVVGVGKFAQKQAKAVLGQPAGLTLCCILHPSPASPLANRGWDQQATQQLIDAGVWRQA